MTSVTCEIQWLTFLLQDLQIPFKAPALLYCDNQSAIHIATNPVFHERTKHIELDCHIVREKAQHELLRLLPIPSSCQLADIYSKALGPRQFRSLVSKLRILNIYSPACRGILEKKEDTLEGA
uniref:Copia protein n=1 Tax=Cajanus cajan TaxID=3821 RepID=A0A151QT54_CAJCA|nr:Copia protein [Cajanus cajan]